MILKDAVWLSLQTIVPPSIRVTSRPFMHEDAIIVVVSLCYVCYYCCSYDRDYYIVINSIVIITMILSL